jgi:hypothetical protein
MKQIAILMVLAFASVTGMAALTVAEATAFSQAPLADASGSFGQ